MGKHRCDEKSNSGGSFESFLCPLASRFITTKLILATFSTSDICENKTLKTFVETSKSNYKPQDQDSEPFPGWFLLDGSALRPTKTILLDLPSIACFFEDKSRCSRLQAASLVPQMAQNDVHNESARDQTPEAAAEFCRL